MKLGFIVNDVATEDPRYTTVRLAMIASRMGHEAWLLGVEDFTQSPDGTITARAHAAPGGAGSGSGSGLDYDDSEAYLAALQGDDGVHERITVDELDAVMLRNDPAADAVERPWAVTSGVLFGQLMVARGTIVLNDPANLANAVNKTYFQHFPEAVRPATLISLDVDEITSFIDDVGGRAVLKPLQGSGGSSVFMVSSDESPNLQQMIEAIARDGYIVAQEFLPDAENGDVRLFVMNGEPLERDGHYAAFRRVNRSADLRSNMSAGGKAERVEVTDRMLELVDIVRPKLRTDGMFLVGLDIVGDKLMEVNVFSPGGLHTCKKLYEADFEEAVIEALDDKVALRRHYPTGPSNATVATL
jgi:glutathione synthase